MSVLSVNNNRFLAFQLESERSSYTESDSKIRDVALLAIASMVSFVFYTAGYIPLSIAVLAGAGLMAISRFFCRQMAHVYVNVPKIDMRDLPTAQSKVASQAIFGEKVKILDTAWALSWPDYSWTHIAASDGYKGWVPSSVLISRGHAYAKKEDSIARVSDVRGGYLYAEKGTEYGPKLIVPYSTTLHVLDSSDARWLTVALPDGREYYIQKGDTEPEKAITSRDELIEFSKKFLGAHYAWGGKSDEYDCSGFVQMLYDIGLNIKIPRDSKDQINDPQFEDVSLHDLEPGNLVFFGGAPDKIRHVGMCIGDGQFIHPAVTENQPRVRISNLDDPDWNGTLPLRPYRAFRRLTTDVLS